MKEIWRVTVLLLGAPFTRRARRDVWFCAAEAITGLAEHAPDVMIADIRMPPTHTDDWNGSPLAVPPSTRK